MTTRSVNEGLSARPIRSVLRALAIVDSLAAHPHGATPKSLSTELGLHLSTTYHLFNTLVVSGYVVRDAESRLFQMGPRIPYLQHRFQRALASSQGVMPFLTALHQATGETVHLGRLLGDDTIVVATLAGSRVDASPAGYVGFTMPAHISAMGQALLAWLTPTQITSYLARADFSARPPLKAAVPAQIRQRLECIRADGYALDPGGHTPPLVGCVAAPICRAGGSAELAMAVIVPFVRFEQDKETLIKQVVSVARAASEFAADGRVGDDEQPETLTAQLETVNAIDWIGTKIAAPKSVSRTLRPANIRSDRAEQ